MSKPKTFGQDETTIEDAAKRIGVHENTIRNWMNSGRAPFYKLPTGTKRASEKWVASQVEIEAMADAAYAKHSSKEVHASLQTKGEK